ncbi:MAG: hypothetical protein HOG49_36580 [Candidatus Scalindua sp.]|jgi:hypothetical protein|nr:hypothetical protein [Candidatus Scalindua sp.]
MRREVTMDKNGVEEKFPANKLVNEHCYLFCSKLGQRRNTECCIAVCADKDRKFTEGWKDKLRNRCKVFQLWLPEELRATVKVDKRKKRKKNAKVKKVVSIGTVSVSVKELNKNGRGRPSKDEIYKAAYCAVNYMEMTSCCAKKASEYVAKHCRLSADTIIKGINKINL